MQSKAGKAELSTRCPHCGQVLVRPADFSAERLLYLHQKWGPCFPLAGRAPDARPGPAGDPPTERAVTAPRSAAG
jgi:hypothetical protein